ncbi:ribonuclease III [Parasulfuritortus cantonensis]|uniref:Ribonuclease 3 n=1 Tax=Parasulfuritortus cantonensis TaxID=2528202 RepID=A0A4R1BEC1_9PROT|nr:ribonuclease III [Parasulfuritortus cantonensis]TCJ15423.1 ribonuclease III [Parasulfuritortus cantonensis]
MVHAPDALQARLGFAFTRPELLEQALTHRSYSVANNERLEFLGDGVLNCVVGALLYERFPELREGQLSRLRANLVNQQPLYEIATELDVGRHLRLGEGELKSGGAGRPSILADAMESILGAAFLDAGFDAARAIVLHLFASRLAEIDPATHGKDAKTLLQEWLQSRKHGLPQYELLGTSGQAHAQTFRVACRIGALGLATEGAGASRKAAEQAAAQAAYQRLARP